MDYGYPFREKSLSREEFSTAFRSRQRKNKKYYKEPFLRLFLRK